MSNYAKIEDRIVTNIIVCEDSQVSTLNGEYIKVTTDTNDAIQGYPYNYEKKKFESPKPYDSWVLNEDTLIWESPIGAKPIGGIYRWDEENKEWDQIL